MSIKLIRNKKDIYNKYDNITIDHCKNLISFLYSRDDKWLNPITKNKIKRSSNIIISFLSKCYYIWGNKKVSINLLKLTYKKHIEKFIDKKKLFDVRKLNGGLLSNETSQISLLSWNLYYEIFLKENNIYKNDTEEYKKRREDIISLLSVDNDYDIICLQETIDIEELHDNYEVINAVKSKYLASIFYKKDRFDEVSTEYHYYKKGGNSKLIFIKDINKGENHWRPIIKTVLKDIKTDEEFMIINIWGEHINYDEGREDVINYLQTKIIKGSKMRIIICGDMNEFSVKPYRLKLHEEAFDNFIVMNNTDTCCYDINIMMNFPDENNTPLKHSFSIMLDNNPDIPGYPIIIGKKFTYSDHLSVNYKFTLKSPPASVVSLPGEYIKPQSKLHPDVPINWILDSFIEKYKMEFNNCCDELVANCDANGILKDHTYISNVVNSIMVIIYTKYLHLDDFSGDIYLTPLYIYMYDQIFLDYYTSEDEANKNFQLKYNNIIYQSDDLTQHINYDHIHIDPNINESYQLNKLFNHQYVFELLELNKRDRNPTIRYNKVNNKLDMYAKDFKKNFSRETFNYAKTIFSETPFNYNIRNSVLPKYIFCSGESLIVSYFEELLLFINNKLQTLPDIKGLSRELTEKHSFYDNILANMKKEDFGNNETNNGSYDMIRKNILYSINILQTRKENIYYNQEYSGAFPIFSWIPLTNNKSDTYDFSNFDKWQPLEGISDSEYMKIREAYTNYGKLPGSKDLNDIIYKVIKGEIEYVVNESLKKRLNETIGIYKDATLSSTKNKKIYLYHGTKNRLHSINDGMKDIQILGFLSTSINIHIAEYYAQTKGTNGKIIYIIEVDGEQKYINLNDKLFQIILLPFSIIRIIFEFNIGDTYIILCRLIRSPGCDQNNLLYNKLLGTKLPQTANIIYTIDINDNDIPKCVYMDTNLWKKNIENYKDLKIYSMTNSSLKYIYFSLGQEYELYIGKWLSISLVVHYIKYTIHQYFIKDCYKALGIPCLDYIFIHTDVDNGISTGILYDDYINNRTTQFKYDVNNFLIDCIFKFDSINHHNKKLNLPNIDNGNIYADKIEGFRNAGLYLHGIHNPLFNSSEIIGEHIQYIRNWKHLFIKYAEASDDELFSHFKWCNTRIDKLIEIIDNNKINYLTFINDILKQNNSSTQAISEKKELTDMINNLTDTLKERANFFINCTSTDGIPSFIKIIKELLQDEYINIHNSKLYLDNIQEDLKNYDTYSGGKIPFSVRFNKILPSNLPTKKKYKQINYRKHKRIYDAFKNIPITESKDMRKFSQLPKAFREYYKGFTNKEGYIDINNYCYCRSV